MCSSSLQKKPKAPGEVVLSVERLQAQNDKGSPLCAGGFLGFLDDLAGEYRQS
jgi:hypothetical protein